MRRSLALVLSRALVAPLLALSACGTSATTLDGGGDGGGDGSAAVDAATGPDLATPPRCDLHGGAGTTRFVDATDAWNLGQKDVSGMGALAATGNRIVSGDLDGDGYPDLIVHAISENARETIGTPPRLVAVYMNRPRPDGSGRMFVDATTASGLFQTRDASTTQRRAAHLAALGDVDNDGDLDVFSGTYVDSNKPDPGDRSEILLNDGSGTFHFAPASATTPSTTQRWPTTGATFVDADRDGQLDLFVGFWYARYGYTEYGVQAQLYKGKGDGTFTSITDAAGLTTDQIGFDSGTNHRPAYGVTSCDVDGDGAPELLVSAYGRQWNLLYQNDGDAHFTDVGQASGYAGDMLRDYSDNQFFACYCTLHMQDAPDCKGVKAPIIQCPSPADSYWSPGSDDQPWRLNGNTFTTYCSDLDGDGDLDLYSAEIRHWHIGNSSDPSELLRSSSVPGKIAFDRPGNAKTGMTWPHPTSDWNEGALMVSGGDLDGDGREDLIVAASDYPDQFGLVFHQKPDHTFEEVGQAWGLHHACMSGLTVADFDRDGDLDVVVGSGTARDCAMTWKTNEVHLYENKGPATGTPGRWLLVRLVGDGKATNREAIGARVTVSVGGGDVVVRQLEGGHGHMAQRDDSVLYLGVGACGDVDVTVRWPNRAATEETWKAVATSRFIELREGDPAVHDVTLK